IDPAMIAITVFVLALIMLSGYLIIYSVFAISVNADIRFYGLLKTIGTTGKQIRALVRGQALVLSAIGIPIGLTIGTFTGLFLAPLASNILDYELGGSANVNPLVFLFSALFSLFTVFVSCRKPAGIASKVPSIEAAKYNTATVRTKKRKATRKITPISFAWANITREKKKLFTIVLSLSLSLILLNSAFSASGSFDLNEYVRESVVSDFALADSMLYTPSAVEVGDGIPASVSKDIAAQPGISNMENIYFRNEDNLSVPPENKKNFEELKAALIKAIPQRESYFNEYENRFDLQIYGIGEQLAEQIGIDYDKLNDGVYAAYSDIEGERVGIHNVGDTIHLTTDSGDKDLTVVGLFQNEDYPYAASARYSSLLGDTLLMTDKQFTRLYGEVQPMQVNINVVADKIEAFEVWLNDYIEKNAPALSFVSRNKLKGEFEGIQRTYLGIGGALSLVLALIGILNFVNAMVTSIFARRREFAMLQSVGMTGRQLKRTLFFEGGGYTLLTAIFTLTIGFGLTYLITGLIAGQVWFFRQSLTLLPAIICLPLLLLLCATVPVICYSKLIRESLVERLRVE
ncbi:MAG: FtsX-like permease family protein, partial [Clostridiales Family XIII bacterium]|nr:FtsX-like permease family protein [Clostridiales Family XIII bacterium]